MTTPAPQSQMIISDFNLLTLDTAQLQTHISCSIDARSNIAIFGRRGVGKTQISKQIIKDKNLHEVYVNLSVFERVDMGGYPDMLSPKQKEEKFINYLLPRIYEPMIVGNKKVVAILDEVDKADPSLWAPLLELLQEKTINGRELPNLLSFILTGNLISEGGFRPSLPLLDRTEKYLVEASVDAWLKWANERNEIHPSVYQYITDHPECLIGTAENTDHYADESPRGWHNSSKVIRIGEAHAWDVSVITDKICGFVGKKSGSDYKMYFTNYKVLLPLIEKVFHGENVKLEWAGLTPTEKLYATIIMCGRLATQLDASKPDNPPEAFTHVGKFMQSAGDENVLMGIRRQIGPKRIVTWKMDQNPYWTPAISAVMGTIESV